MNTDEHGCDSAGDTPQPCHSTMKCGMASFGILVYIVSIAGSAAIDFYNKIKDLKSK